MICASRIPKTSNQGVNQGNLCHIECIKLRAPGAPWASGAPSAGALSRTKKNRKNYIVQEPLMHSREHFKFFTASQFFIVNAMKMK